MCAKLKRLLFLITAVITIFTAMPTGVFAATVSEDNITDVIEDEDSKYKIKITVDLAKKGWYKDKARVNVKVEKIYGNAKFRIETVEVRIGANGSYEDITDDMAFEITENCTAYVKVTDVNGKSFEKARRFSCFDTVAPTLNAAVSEGLLTVMSYDTESGVKEIYINEYKFVPDANGIVTVRLQKFDASFENFYIYAVDHAGNKGDVSTVKNPYYKDPNAEEKDDDDKANPADELPQQAEKEETPPATAAVTSVTDEDGNDISQEVKRKQFYTIVTSDGQQFYLVIDMSPAYTDDDGVNVTPEDGTVYFLTSVSNRNLLNFVDTNEQTLPRNSVAAQNGIDVTTYTPEMDDSAPQEEEEAQEEEKGTLGGNLFYILIFAGVILVVVVVKLASGKKGKADQNDDALYEEVQEDVEGLDSLNESEE